MHGNPYAAPVAPASRAPSPLLVEARVRWLGAEARVRAVGVALAALACLQGVGEQSWDAPFAQSGAQAPWALLWIGAGWGLWRLEVWALALLPMLIGCGLVLGDAAAVLGAFLVPVLLLPSTRHVLGPAHAALRSSTESLDPGLGVWGLVPLLVTALGAIALSL